MDMVRRSGLPIEVQGSRDSGKGKGAWHGEGIRDAADACLAILQ